MRKEYFILLAVIVLVGVGIAGGLAKTAFQEPAGPESATVTGFRLAHPALRPGERTSVQVEMCGNALGSTYVWKAEGGALSVTDTDQVIWTAPELEGHYQVSVEVTDAGGRKSRGSAGILVTKYPGNSLIMNTDPAACKTAKQ